MKQRGVVGDDLVHSVGGGENPRRFRYHETARQRFNTQARIGGFERFWLSSPRTLTNAFAIRYPNSLEALHW